MNPQLADAPLSCSGGEFDARYLMRLTGPRWECRLERVNARYAEVIDCLRHRHGFERERAVVLKPENAPSSARR